MPLYENAYLQVAMGAVFLRFKRSWIHPMICLGGLAGILITYYLQDKLNWQLPASTRADWIASVVIFFGLTLAIQKFSISTHQKAEDNFRRFGVIGRDAARLTHDLKGLLSSPMMVLEVFRNKNMSMPAGFYERQMTLLIQDMDRVRESIHGISRLATVEEALAPVDVNEVLQSALSLLGRRLKNISISLPVAKNVLGNSERLHSIFFNLLINSIQAFEFQMKSQENKVEIYWEKNALIFKDNAGGLNSHGPIGTEKKNSGLGLEIIFNDAQIMGADFKIFSKGYFTFARIKFPKNSILEENTEILAL